MSEFWESLPRWITGMFPFIYKLKNGILSDFQIIIAFVMVVSLYGWIIILKQPGENKLDKTVQYFGFFCSLWCGHWVVVNLLG